ncbi:hypothetical protein [Asticcacaulis sp. W401b]|uniref:hypothetical protein n=1 Tax=Asticcacaulis sp. W401b TaxID=3388666 RepID=UPI003970C867
MRSHTLVALAALTLVSASGVRAEKKSSLDNFEFDGITTDRSLKRSGTTRERWLQLYPVMAKVYWDAWDCKGKSCDSSKKARIREKAALIPRPASGDASNSPAKPMTSEEAG